MSVRGSKKETELSKKYCASVAPKLGTWRWLAGGTESDERPAVQRGNENAHGIKGID